MFISGNIYYNNMRYIKWIRLCELIFKQYILFVQFSVLQENVPFATLMTGKPLYSVGSFISVTWFFFCLDSSSELSVLKTCRAIHCYSLYKRITGSNPAEMLHFLYWYRLIPKETFIDDPHHLRVKNNQLKSHRYYSYLRIFFTQQDFLL